MIFVSFFGVFVSWVELRKSVMREEQTDLENERDKTENAANAADQPRKENKNAARALLNPAIIYCPNSVKLCDNANNEESSTHEQTKTSCEELHHCFIHLSEGTE